MRFKLPKFPPEPVCGEIRETTKFLLWPRCDGHECRWLETATLVHKFRWRRDWCYWEFLGFKDEVPNDNK